MKLCAEARKAAMIGSICALSYLAVYMARNILGAVSPQMIESGAFTTENIGRLSSVYFITYAAGQLINGRIGDRIRAKYMISFGLILAGFFDYLILPLCKSFAGVYLAYAMTGFSLSMIYGPLTKVVAENTTPVYATRCSLGYTFSSFVGTPLAGILAAFLSWQDVFAVGSLLLVVMGCVAFVFFSAFERRGLIRHGQYKPQSHEHGTIGVLIQNRIIRFTFVAVITGIVRTTVVFWLPTYLTQYLGFSTEHAALIFTAGTTVISFCSFLAVFVYERLGYKLDLTIRLAFAAAGLCFLLAYFCGEQTINIVAMVLAILFSNCASSMLWSRYCPGLRDTGMVSTGTGFLNFMSYMAAAVSSPLFANAATAIGWQRLILVWFGLMVLGVLVMLPNRKGA